MAPIQPMMRAIGVSEYGPVSNLTSKQIPQPSSPQGRQMLVQVKGVSVNPIDLKVRNGTYDDAPDYYSRVKSLTQESPNFHVMGYDGAGTVLEVGPDVKNFKKGDHIFYLGSPVLQGSYAEKQLVDERHAGHKPHSLDFVQSAAMPLTYATAYEALVDRLGIRKDEKAGILIINGGGGMGSIASQIARWYLKLPVVITTASRIETAEFSRKNGASHVVNHREDIVKQIDELKSKGEIPADIPIRYAFITSRTEQYIQPIGDILAPFGKACSIVQGKFDMYGSQFMSKSLTFVWCWLASGAYHGYMEDDEEKHHRWYEELAKLIDEGVIKCHLTSRKKLTLQGIKSTHELLESGKGLGKTALGVDDPEWPGEGDAFC